jgi:hypothetical protein
MAIFHKFKEIDFGKGFATKDAILVETPFKPEILFIGTFNPLTNEKDNTADCFYGRNWFWPILFNIFHYKKIELDKQRKFYKPNPKPSLAEIFEFMKLHKITFADLITQVLEDKDDYCLAKNKIIFKETNYDLIKDSDLSKLSQLGKIKWNKEELIKYIENNPTIKTFYFTRKPTKPFSDILIEIREKFINRNLKIKFLFTPSGQSMKGKPRINALVNQWKSSYIEGFDNLDEEWLNANM